jgi:hypothetical protein
MNLPAGIGIEDELRKPLTVTEVNENEPAVIAVRMNPPGKLNSLADVGRTELAAGVRAVARLDGLHFWFLKREQINRG